ncbi:Coenzyme F420 hydrogenase subunit beta [Candidatus Methanobinarius endosymbioticus]|uniref:Coenzyme F420 hydrogenase subunit beta n=1 Tax=Candidatus Methanobinarius endosymbioticus TaxID=2006182 RepID=A0A366MBH5_9EURY|nr:Coenzyme F420 hydrogenase subunit beta [Candidatus Methanobinarius endosymbioticus]
MVLGTYKEAVSARATEKQIQKVAQDGGIVTALLSYALDEGIIEGAVVAGPSEELWKPEPLVAMTSEEIISAAGTKYTFSPNVAALKKAVRQYGLEKVGTVGTPCQLNGIRKMQSYPFGTRFLADKMTLVVGIFCMENFPFASLETFINEKMKSSPEVTEKMDIGKGKFWIKALGEDIGFPLKETHGYEQAGCNICPDYTAELADLSTGSVGAPDGWSTVLKRTDAGASIFDQAVKAGIIETKDISTVKPGLPLLEKLSLGKKDGAKKESDNRRELGLPVPF